MALRHSSPRHQRGQGPEWRAAQTRCACFGATNANDQFVISASPQCIASGRSRARRAGRSDAVADRRAPFRRNRPNFGTKPTPAHKLTRAESFQRVSCAFAQLSRAFCLHFKDLVPRSAEGASRKDAALPFVSGARKLQKQRKRNKSFAKRNFFTYALLDLEGRLWRSTRDRLPCRAVCHARVQAGIQ